MADDWGQFKRVTLSEMGAPAAPAAPVQAAPAAAPAGGGDWSTFKSPGMADTPNGFDIPEPPPAKKPSLLGRALGAAGKYASETLADAAQAGGTMGGLLNAPMALAGTLGSYFLPGQRGGFTERYWNELRGLEGRQAEAQQRSPISTAVAPMVAAGIGMPSQVAQTLSPLSTAVRGSGALARGAAGVADAALTSAGMHLLSRPGDFEGAKEAALSPSNLMGAMGPAMETAVSGGEALRDAAKRLALRSVAQSPITTARAYENFGSYEKAGEVLSRQTNQSGESLTRPGVSERQRLEEFKVAHQRNGREVGSLVDDAVKSGASFDWPGFKSALYQAFNKHFGSRVATEVPSSHEAKARAEAQKLVDEIITAYEPKALAAREVPELAAGQPSGPIVPHEGGTVLKAGRSVSPLGPETKHRTMRPKPDTGWKVLQHELPVTDYEYLKSAMGSEANLTAGAMQRPEVAMQHDPLIRFKNTISGILADFGESAITNALGPEAGKNFKTAKENYAATALTKEGVAIASHEKQAGTQFGAASHVWPSEKGVMAFLWRNLYSPTQQRVGAALPGIARTMEVLTPESVRAGAITSLPHTTFGKTLAKVLGEEEKKNAP